MTQKWGTLEDLVLVSGLARRTLQYIRKQEPGVLITRQRAGKTEYDLGACNVQLRRREREQALTDARGDDKLAEAERRKAVAEAGLAETKLLQVQAKLIPLDDHMQEVESILASIRAALLAHPATRTIAPEILASIRDRAPDEIEQLPDDAVA